MKKIQKKITFIYTDKVEYQCAEPIAEEAKKRGFEVEFSDNIFKKCEIGFYFQHLCYPKNSKFSVVMLHDLGQQHTHWPCIWKNEFWNDFDLGFLPTKEWEYMWQQSSCYDFARPRYGCYYSGWQKADKIKQSVFKDECQKIIKDYNIDISKKNVLYAPSWEWGNRQLEIVEVCNKLGVNLIIKQAPWNPSLYPAQVKEIYDMAEKTKGFNNVYIFDPNISIFNAINLCDVLVSEESSTLFEAMILDKPVIAVTDWLVPDSTPPRLPDFPYDFAVRVPKKNLCDAIKNVLEDKSYLDKIIEYRQKNFPNLGEASKTIVDVLCDVLDGCIENGNRITELALTSPPPEYKKSIAIRKKNMKIKEIKYRYVEKSVFLSKIWNLLKYIKGCITND